MFFDGTVPIGAAVSGVESNALKVMIDAYLVLGIFYLHFVANMSVRDTIVMFVLAQPDVAVFHHFHPAELLHLEAFCWQGKQVGLFLPETIPATVIPSL